jgi:hypothetical protein
MHSARTLRLLRDANAPTLPLHNGGRQGFEWKRDSIRYRDLTQHGNAAPPLPSAD